MHPTKDDVVTDEDVLSKKEKVMNRLKWGSLLTSIADTCKFVAGPMFGIGIGAALATSITAALPLAVLGASAAFLAIGIASGYAASRVWQSGNFDNLEINAQSTAHHLVQELKQNNLCLTEEKDAQCRSDGKTWVQHVSSQQSQPQVTQTRLH